jgi:hypothetical protein
MFLGWGRVHPMEYISAIDESQASNAEHATDGKSEGLKRCMMTVESLTLLSNTLMDPIMMNEYGLILETTPTGRNKNPYVRQKVCHLILSSEISAAENQQILEIEVGENIASKNSRYRF